MRAVNVRKSSLAQLGLPSRRDPESQGNFDCEEPEDSSLNTDKENQIASSDVEGYHYNPVNAIPITRHVRASEHKGDSRDPACVASLSEKPKTAITYSNLPSSVFNGHASTASSLASHDHPLLPCVPPDSTAGRFPGALSSATVPASKKPAVEEHSRQSAVPFHPVLPGLAPCERDSVITISLGGIERRFKKVAQIGRGGSSKVFKVVSEDDFKAYALKEVYTKGVDASVKKAYLNEIMLLKQLKDRQEIITLYECKWNKEEGVLSLLLEFAETDFATIIKKQCGATCKNPFSHLYYWHEMLQVVKVIHDAGVIHNDLKPENFVLVGGKLKIIDFGIANKIEIDATSIEKDLYSGTLNYMSPEAIQTYGNTEYFKVGKPSDIWSLGCILYSMVYGKSPFDHIANKIKRLQTIADPSEQIHFPPVDVAWKPAIPVIKVCLNRNAKERPTIDQLLSVCSSVEQMLSLAV